MDTSSLSRELQVAIEAAKKGAEKALEYYTKNLKIEVKDDKTPVTVADKEAEEAVKLHILKTFPNAKFVGEETGGEIGNGDFWVIDPIDGTASFVREIPFWATQVAYIRNGKPVIGVSCAPCLDEVAYAEVGKGAFLNDKKLHVSDTKTLGDAFLIHGTIRFFQSRVNGFINLCNQVHRQRGYGDFYGYHLVAEGKADIMMDAHNGPWDIAAVKVIVEEAGGKVTNFEGKEWQLNDNNCIATNEILHDEVVRIVNKKD